MKVLFIFFALFYYIQSSDSMGKIINSEYTMVLDRISLGISFESDKKITYCESLDMQDTFCYNPGGAKNQNILGYTTLNVNNVFLNCTKMKELIYFLNGNLNLTFYYPVNDSDKTIGLEKGISLGFEKENEYNSLTKQLKKAGYIDKAIFSFIPVETIRGGLDFGEFKNDLVRGYYAMTCKVNQKIAKWGCDLSQISFKYSNNTTIIYSNTSYGYFQSSGPFLLVPKHFFDFLVETFFKDLLKKNQCEYVSTFFGYKSLVCECDKFMQNFPIFGFVFDGYRITFKSYSIFTQYGNSCYFVIEYKEGNDNFIFGSSFLLNFISKFDNEENTVSFYSMNRFEKVSQNQIGKQIIFVSIIIQCITCIIILLTSKNLK